MIRHALAVLVLVPLALVADEKKEAAFMSKDGKFSVALPDKPTERTSKTKVGDREVEVHIFTVGLKDRAYLITYSDQPAGSIGEDRDKFLGGVVERNVANLKGKPAGEEKVTLGAKKHPGREARIELPDKKQVYRARVFLVGDRLYQVIAIGPEEFAKGKDVDDYLKSFAVDE